MIRVSRHVDVDPNAVFAVLADGWSYASWVVGSSHIRAVDEGWPAVGTRIHHSIGMWPVQIQDVTVVTSVDPGRMIDLKARMWPAGEAKVRLTLHPDGSGTRVELEEEIVSGPAGLLPKPVQSLLLRPRNAEALARLADLATGQART